MMSKKHLHLTLLAIILLSVPIYSYDKCVHDTFDHPDPITMDPETDNLDSEGRLLQETTTYPNMRIYPYYGAMGSDTAFNNYTKNYLIPPIIDYFQAALQVKYPLGATFKMSVSSVCGISTPSDLQAGVVGDMYWIIADAYDSGSSWLADSYACYLMGGSRRPYIGITTINRWDFTTTTDVLVHEKNIVCIMHEFTHVLGFSNSLYGNFLNPTTGTALGSAATSLHLLDGVNSTVLNVEPLTSKVKAHFGCSSMAGAYMEVSGGSGTVGSHFERRHFANEYMTSGLIFEMVISEFTFALLEGSGWYVPNYGYTEVLTFGQGEGCNFLTDNCDANEYSEWCQGTGRGCTTAGFSGGTCAADLWSEGCRFQHNAENYHCENPNGVKYARFPTAEVYGRGAGSKCFAGTLATTAKAATANSMCLTYQCEPKNTRLLGSSTSTHTSSVTVHHVNGTYTYIITRNSTTTYSNGTKTNTVSVNNTYVDLTGEIDTVIVTTFSCVLDCAWDPVTTTVYSVTPAPGSVTNTSTSSSSSNSSTNSTTNTTTSAGSSSSSSNSSSSSTGSSSNSSSSATNTSSSSSSSSSSSPSSTNSTASNSSSSSSNSSTTSSSSSSSSSSDSSTTATDYNLILNFGSTNVTCAQAGQVSVTGYSGYVTCPDPLEFCTTIGKPACPRNCMGRGTCVNGKCQCNTGFTGTDCTLGPNGEF